MHAADLWYFKSPAMRAARLALTPLSWLYAAGWLGYLGIYRMGLKRAKKPHTPILCVGNLVTGGSGKSPVTLHLADVLGELGFSVVIGASGYGSPRAEAASVAPSGELAATEWGDEPAMFRWLRPDVPLIVGRRRVLAAELCAHHFPGSVLLMDDGFQHLPLRKDISFILDPESPQNSHCLPAGPYREPRFCRSRADLVLPDRFRVENGPIRLSREVQRAQLLCALGQPDQFRVSVEAAGVEIVKFERRPDHDPLTDTELWSGFRSDLPVIVTAKDWVKLRSRGSESAPEIIVAQRDVRIEPATEFRTWLRARLDETLPPTTE